MPNDPLPTRLASDEQGAAPPHSNWKLVLAYDGTDFDGWQVQPNRPTIQGTLSAAIECISGERVQPQGSGRTDRGVHALAQVASFPLAAPIPAANLHRALNRALPAAIRILSAERVPADFHARHSAIAKTYEYRIYRGALCPPWLARYVYAFPAALDVAAMQQAATNVLGSHDFTSFAATDLDRSRRATAGPKANTEVDLDTEADFIAALDLNNGIDLNTMLHPAELDLTIQDAPTNLRTLTQSSWRLDESAEILSYHVTGTGFLHHMVRNLVGTFLNVGRGLTPAAAMPAILAARARASAGPTAPARGLFLVAVDFPR